MTVVALWGFLHVRGGSEEFDYQFSLREPVLLMVIVHGVYVGSSLGIRSLLGFHLVVRVEGSV